MQAGSEVGMHTLDQDLKRLVQDGEIAVQVARAFAADPKTLDGVHIRPQEVDIEAWVEHGERQIPVWGV